MSGAVLLWKLSPVDLINPVPTLDTTVPLSRLIGTVITDLRRQIAPFLTKIHHRNPTGAGAV